MTRFKAIFNSLRFNHPYITKFISLIKAKRGQFISLIKAKKGQWVRGFLIGLVISVCVFFLATLGHFRLFENSMFAILQQINIRQSNDIALLFITKKEYKQGFNNTSPLSRERLAKIIETLVKHHPKAIAVDIDLSDSGEGYDALKKSLRSAEDNHIPVIVPSILKPKIKIAAMAKDNERPTPYLSGIYEKNKNGYILYKGPTALDDELRVMSNVMHGGSVSTKDRDGVFRHGAAFYHTGSGNDIEPSFPLSIAAASQGIDQKLLEKSLKEKTWNGILREGSIKIKPGSSNKEIKIHYGKNGKFTPNFLGNYVYFPYDIDVDRLLKTNQSGTRPDARTIFRDKIVIVGGVYDHNDFYRTPVGKMSGMEVIANMVQSILDHNMITHLNYLCAFIVEVLLGALTALIFILMSPVVALLFCFVTLIPATILLSLKIFDASYYWIDFMPTIFGVMIHGIISKIEYNAHVADVILPEKGQ